MKKTIPFLLLVTVLLLAGCSSLAEIPYSPEQTAETWLEMQPYAELEFAAGSVVLVQPSTTAIVYLLGVWGWLIVTIAAYFLYYISDAAENLWARGMWFTENDVLHVGLIIWMVYLSVIARQVRDETQTSA